MIDCERLAYVNIMIDCNRLLSVPIMIDTNSTLLRSITDRQQKNFIFTNILIHFIILETSLNQWTLKQI